MRKSIGTKAVCVASVLIAAWACQKTYGQHGGDNGSGDPSTAVDPSTPEAPTNGGGGGAGGGGANDGASTADASTAEVTSDASSTTTDDAAPGTIPPPPATPTATATATATATPTATSTPTATPTATSTATTAPTTPPPTSTSKTYDDIYGDAKGAGLDVDNTTVKIDSSGVLTFRIDMPGAARAPLVTDNFQLHIDSDQNMGTGTPATGYEYRIVFFGDGNPQFQVQRWEGGWVNRTPASFTASFSSGIDIRVNAADLGIGSSFAFSIITIDGRPGYGQVSDEAPEGALTERWTYTK